MDLRLSDEQQQLVEAFRALYARESSCERVRAAEPTGFDATLWRVLVASGVVEMAVGEAHGGWQASDLDLALVAEQHGRAVAAAPLIEAQTAAKLLAGCSDGGNRPAADTLATALAGETLITFAPRASRGGRLELLPAGAVADAAVAMVGDRVVLVELTENRVPVENLGSMPLADVDVPPGAAVLAEGEKASQLFSDAVDHWLLLTGAALVGIAARAVELGVSYAQQRHAFGKPIGSFQAVSHPLADSATAVDGARLLAYRAACAVVDQPQRASELAAMAFVFGYETARDATYRSLHIHGGYGFMMEQDVQLYYRRARGWANVFAEPGAVLERVADRRYGTVAS
ncbi:MULTISPECIES: acyl-CoA dehydrogenase family protein [unclassified Mycobacterium]|uniref:acyl-CoA dehydrogenase family protein n=1 Tax=unclassified Mycobacterium TaxID=2642494 RepID=UPI0029C6BE70|nr:MULTISPECIES: acyl-CoA dehydrogenase family protein [unclassified Mycobacterium]